MSGERKEQRKKQEKGNVSVHLWGQVEFLPEDNCNGSVVRAS
jgi:hypothetical protein